MGNTPMTIGLKVDEHGRDGRGIVAGSIVRGRIYLSNQGRKEILCTSIRLKVSGTEEAVVYHPTRKTEPGQNHSDGRQPNQTNYQDCFKRSSDTIYYGDHTIKEYPGGVLPRGQFEFPFALHLPEHLPSTMKAESYQSYCEVRYEIIAEVFQESNSLVHTNPCAKERLIVIAMPPTFAPDHDSSRELPIETIPISNCTYGSWLSCFNTGTMALQTRLDRTTMLLDSPSMPLSSQHSNNRSNIDQQRHILLGGDHSKSFGFQFRCENKSNSTITMVRADLTEIIEWRSHGYTEKITKTLGSTTMECPEVRTLCRKPFFLKKHRVNDSERALLFEHEPWYSIDPSIGVDATSVHDTYYGKAVRVRHMLTLSMIMGDCCGTNHDISTRVEIYRNPLAFGVDPEKFATTTSEDEPSGRVTISTAPSAAYDINGSVRTVQAKQVMPEDWNAHEEELVNIPIVEATVVEQ